MNKSTKLRESFKAILLTAAFGLSSAALAQPSITVSSASGMSGDTGLSVTVEFTDTAPASTEVIDVRLDLNPAVVANIDLTGCQGNMINGVTVQCSNPNPGQVNILVFPFPPMAIDSGTIGTIGFDIDNAAPIGVSPIQFIFEEYTGPGATDITPNPTDSTLGTITVQAPAGGFYGSTPAPGQELDLGEAVVNSLASPIDTLTVDNASTDAFDVTGFSSAATELTLPSADPYTIPASGSVAFDGVIEDAVVCTPSAVGANTGSFAVAHDGAGGATSPVSYDFTCKGLAPNVEVDPIVINLNGQISGPAQTATFDVSNLDNVAETTSDAQNVQLTPAGDPQISISDGLTDNILVVDETDTVEVSCSTMSDGMFSSTITVSWDDPETMGTATQDVTVNCDIANVAPGYSSNPGPMSLLAFGTVENGDTSAAQTIDIGNENSIGMGAGAELDITGATLSDPVNYAFSPDPLTATLPAGAANGTASVDVTCNPQSIGSFPGTLTVNTNDGDQDYDLSCEGTSNAELSVTPATAVDGTLLLGTVPPNTLVSGSLTLSNLGTDPLEIDCTLTNNNGGVIVGNPWPAFPISIPPDLTLTFDGVPPNVGSFEETLECTVTDPSVTGAPDTFSTTISVAGRPLAIPTMSPWALAVMSLMLLLVAGFAGRRMMA